MDLDNITYRRPHKTSSLNDIANINDESYLFDTTMMSLPDNTQNNKSQISSELQEKIELLTRELKSAHNEIENLHMENFRLKTDLQKSLKQIETFKTINTSIDRKSLTPCSKYSKKKSSSRATGVTPTKQQITKDAINNVNNNQLTFIKTPDKDNSRNILCSENLYNKSITTDNAENEIFSRKETDVSNIQENTAKDKSTQPEYKQDLNVIKKVYVVADCQGWNVRYTLQNLLGSTYKVYCYWKSGAKICDILASLNNVEVTSNDFIIILGGTNDTNPFDFQSDLSTWFKKDFKANIIVSQVPYNRYLNEYKLNYLLRYLCHKFNATFVDMRYNKLKNNSYYTYNLCRYLLKEILCIDYHTKFKKYNIAMARKKEQCTQTLDTFNNSKYDKNVNVDNSILPIFLPNKKDQFTQTENKNYNVSEECSTSNLFRL